MAKGKVATAYVEIRPDLDNFAKELRAKLVAQNAKLKVPVEADTKSMAASVRRMANDPSVRDAVKSAADDMAKLQVQALKDNKAFDDERKRQNALMLRDAYRENDEWRKVQQAKVDAENAAVKEVNRAHAEALAEQKRANDQMLREAYRHNSELDGIRRQAKRDADQASSTMLRDAYRENAEFEKIRKEKIKAEDAFTKEINRVHSVALKENDDFDKANRPRIVKWFEDLQQSLRKVSNGWLGLFLNPVGAAIAAGLVLIVGGLVGAILNTFTVAVLGAIPIVIGILGNKAKPAFAEAAQTMVGGLKDMLSTAAEPMLFALVRAMNTITAGLGPIQKIGMEIMGGLNTQIDQLAKGLLGFVRNLSAGIAASMPGIQALLSALANSLPRLGQSIGEAFKTLTKNPEQLASAIEGLITLMQNLIKVTATVVQWFTFFFEGQRKAQRQLMDTWNIAVAAGNGEKLVTGYKKFWADITGETDRAAQRNREATQKIADDTTNLVNKIQGLEIKGITSTQIEAEIARMAAIFGTAAISGEGFKNSVIKNLQAIGRQLVETNWYTYAKDAADGFRSIDTATKQTRKSVDELIDSIDILNGRFVDLEDATDSFYTIQNDVADEMNSGLKVAFDDFSRTGIAHQKVIRDQAAALVDVVKAELKQGQALDQIMPKFGEMRQQISDNATAFSGSRTAAENYLAALRLTPKEIITQLALAGMPEAMTELEKLTGEKTVPIKADPGNQFELVGEYIVEQMTNAGNHAGESFEMFMRRKTTESFYDNQTNWRLVGNNAGQSIIDGMTEPNWRLVGEETGKQIAEGVGTPGPAYHAAEGIHKDLHDGLNGPGVKGKNYNDGVTIANTVSQGMSSTNMQSAATSIVSSLSSGLKSQGSSNVIKDAGSFLAGLFRGAFQGNSPPEYGPLSGTGYTYYVGQTLVSDLAKGMIAGESKVEKASTRVAAAIALGGRYGLTGFNVGPVPLGVNVYVGNERLDAHIDYRVERNDEVNARGLFAGRTEV